MLFFFICTHTLPLVGVIVPVYVIAKSIGLLDNLLSLVLLHSAMNIPIVVWLLRSFLLEIPSGIREAARIDGASLPQELFRVVLPLIAPGMAATAIICAIFAWNEFFFAVNLTTTQASTVPLFPISCIITRRLFWAKLSAVATPAVLPILLLGWAAQRQMIRGLSMGALD